MDTQTTAQQQEQYTRALKRAHDEGCRIAGTMQWDGNTEWSVESPKHPDGYYTVRLSAGAREMTCNCEAGQRHIYCKHRSLCRAAVEAERAPKHTERVTVGALRMARQAALSQPRIWS